MRSARPTIALTSLAALLLGGCERVQAERPRSETGFAVVELFTSEGCSSCPPADALLAEIEHEAARAKTPVYTLSFHVDYWNQLGWRDPWSAAWASARQRAYAGVLGGGIYTPQMVVNGRTGFIGSHATQARTSIRDALAQPAALSFKVESKRADAKLSVEVVLGSAPAPNSQLQVALVERQTTSRVKDGENAGRQLVHTDVVRSFQTEPLNGQTRSSAQLAWPQDLTPERAALVVYVQDSRSLEIVAAVRSAISVE